MPHIKKTVVMFLVAAMLSGGAWYLNTTGVIGGISSSALSTTFSCSEDSLSEKASAYRKVVSRHTKGLVIKKQLEAEIVALKNSDPGNELQKKEATLKSLTRQINIYLRFIRKYDTCKKEIHLVPTVATGVMSGEAKVEVSQKEYQALAAFEIGSPLGLKTSLKWIQFKVDVSPVGSITTDAWFLLHEGADPVACFADNDSGLIECELWEKMPSEITKDASQNYWLWAHITTLRDAGTVKIQISKIYFNDGRTTSEISFAPKVLTFGTTTMPLPESVPPTVDAAVAPPATVIVPPLAPSPTSESSQTIQQTPDASTVASPESSFPTTIPEVPTTELTMTPPSSEIPAGAPVTSETTTETVTTSPTSSETTTPPPTTTAEASDPVVPPSVDPITPPSSETPPASTTIVEAVYIPLLW